METLAPAVVAVIVTCDPGPWFIETLRAFASQEYPELSVLVLDAGSAEDPTALVAAELPGAFVRLLGVNRGFGASANEALTMVEGASHFLFCHDDVAPAPDAVHQLVEESYRSNAGVVAPKLVSWDDPERLLHVGMAVDKGGAVVDRVEPGEVDHGQHDAVRDVFLAPGGCTLVRADLFAELGGFDPDIFAMGEDLDLCWRAQIAGARVLVAPLARVRHHEVLASGRRQLPESVLVDIPVEQVAEGQAVDADADADADAGAAAVAAPGVPDSSREGSRPVGDDARTLRHRREIPGRHRSRRRVPAVTLQSLQRRHELHVVLKSYGRFHLIRVLPQLMALASAEYCIARASGHRDRAAAVAHAWRWNYVRRRAIRSERVEVQSHRILDDAEVRRLQLHGSARLNAYVRRAVNQGLKAAHLGAGNDVGEGEAARDSAHRRRIRADALSLRVVAGAVAVAVLVFGTRQLLGSGFPYVGQLLPLPSAGTLLHRFLSGWQPSGVGTTDPTSPATGILGVAGMVLFGGVGLLQKIVVLGCVPAGALGMARLVRPMGSRRARLVSTLVYLAVPLPYDALATGRLDALLGYAAGPWIVGFLARASRCAPFGPPDADEGPAPVPPPSVTAGAGGGGGAQAVQADSDGVPGSQALPDAVAASGVEGAGPSGADRHTRRWRTTLMGQIVCLGLLDALLTSAAPSGALLVLVTAAGLALGTLVTAGHGARRAAARILLTALGATAVAFVLLVPWSTALLSGPDRWQALTGLATAPSAAAGWGAILRLALGPIGDSPLSWAFLASAALPLAIGSRWRLAWAGRVWVMAVVAWVLTWAVGHGWLGPVAPSPQVLLVPAAVAIAFAVGLGAASFESDLPGYRFGWRQMATVVAAVAAAIGVIPVLLASSNGRWDLPLSGYGEATSWMGAHSGNGAFRVLWLGDPRVLPGGGWQLAPGLAYSISENGLGDATEIWSGSSPGAAAAVGDAVDVARRGGTVRLGQLLAPYAVRYVVVVDNLAPSIPGYQSPLAAGPPADLDPALLSQLDLRQIIGQGGFEVFIDDAALPERAVLASGHPAVPPPPSAATTATPTTTTTTTTTTSTTTPPSPVGADQALMGWRPALHGTAGATQASGRVPAGTVLAAVAPSRAWELVEPGGDVQPSKQIFGYAASFDVVRPGPVTVKFRGSWVHGLEVAVEVLLWLLVVALLVCRRRSLARLSSRIRRRRARRARSKTAPAVVPDAVGDDVGETPGLAVPDTGVATGAAPR
ncbi:MAG TPA: glycosyltransferase family 2 protein [Acidimicrobiales bacterium]|nr:glycosyltransferase family 2 protein [Acidimicrobiales bacterium]